MSRLLAGKTLPTLAVLVLFLACTKTRNVEAPPTQYDNFPGTGGTGGEAVDCDRDGDGSQAASCGGPDCDDTSDAVHPGAEEICNGIDDNCDGNTDEGCSCSPGDLRSCFTGNAAQRNVGICKEGWQQCNADGKDWGACQDQVLAGTEADGCDGIDSDCDGRGDPPGRCSACRPGAEEICGNGLDDDCNGTIDDPDICVVDCSSVNPRSVTGALACCAQNPPTAYESVCADYPGLPGCTTPDRKCIDLDLDPATACVKQCSASVCQCGRPNGSQPPTPVPDCGFRSACSLVDCGGQSDQPCYSGPPSTLGKGMCKSGTHSCTQGDDGSRSWDECVGEVVPGVESCGNGIDDDCDGRIDEDDGAGRPCPNRSACAPDAVEICGNGLDDDCDGFADEGCPASAGGNQKCWTGSLATRNVGTCRDGLQHEQAGVWGPCTGQVLPSAEVCGDGKDTDCNGLGAGGEDEDAGCCIPHDETCNGLDDDCDGIADEGVRTACGTCIGGDACYGLSIDNPGDCTVPGRSCTRVQSYPLDDQAITLRTDRLPPPSQILWEVTSIFGASAQVGQIDIRTGNLARNIAGPENGFPNDLSTAVDDSLWVAYFNFGTSTSVQHFDKTGQLVCALAGLSASHIAADPAGGAWLVYQADFSSPFMLRRLGEGSDDHLPDGQPACPIIDLVPDATATDIQLLEGGNLVVDAGGWVWISGSSLQRVDGFNPQGVEKVSVTTSTAATSRLAVGSDDTIISSNPLQSLTFDGNLRALGPGVTDLLVAPDGTLWGNQPGINFAPDTFLHIDPVGRAILSATLYPAAASSFGTASGVAMDGLGRIWAAQASEFDRLDPVNLTWDVFPTVTNFYSPMIRAGSSSLPQRFAAYGRGRFTQQVDSGSFRTRWDTVRFDGTAPAGSRVRVYVRFADDPTGFDTSPFVCGPFDNGAGALALCSGGRRFAQLDAQLSGTNPVVGHFKITWDRQ